LRQTKGLPSAEQAALRSALWVSPRDRQYKTAIYDRAEYIWRIETTVTTCSLLSKPLCVR